MHTKTIAELSRSLQAKEFSSVELTQHFLDRIHKFDSQLKSFITVCDDTALANAQLADTRIAAGDTTVADGHSHGTKRYLLH